jgi:hypothetical protein
VVTRTLGLRRCLGISTRIAGLIIGGGRMRTLGRMAWTMRRTRVGPLWRSGGIASPTPGGSPGTDLSNGG